MFKSCSTTGEIQFKYRYEKTAKAMSSVKSAYTTAATFASKRVEEIRESVAQQQLTPSTGLSPASSYQYLSAPEPSRRDDDASSTCSTDSRRPSVNAAASDYVNDQSGMDWTIPFQLSHSTKYLDLSAATFLI